jgi:hypothetical protein
MRLGVSKWGVRSHEQSTLQTRNDKRATAFVKMVGSNLRASQGPSAGKGAKIDDDQDC